MCELRSKMDADGAVLLLLDEAVRFEGADIVVAQVDVTEAGGGMPLFEGVDGFD